MVDRDKSLKPERGPSASHDPLHGVTLETVVTHLHAEYGWDELARRIPVRCFQRDPSVMSSLKFLRKTPWAREQVEGEYVRLARRENSNSLVLALKEGRDIAPVLETLSQTKLLAALAWALRHLPADETTLRQVPLPLLAAVHDVNFWPDSVPTPLLNIAIDRDASPAFIRELLRRGADANDARYWLPLLHTVDREGLVYQSGRRAPRTDVLDLLLSHGADPTRADVRGHTALDMARAYGLKAVIHKLAPGA